MSKAPVIAALAAVLFSMPCWPQASNGRVSGTVQDESRAVVPNANIELTNPATGVTHRSRSNDTGFYAFPGLVPGTYKLAAEVPGMQRFVASVVVQVQQSVVVDPVMRVAQTTSTVEVVEATPLVTTDNPTLGRVLERTRIEQLPINGRS
ncbi:MAG TPA: carboxypeptidase-like regulatory domain-containing protein, partial [Bryobacteraceae bacterium]|nr:carboxypeptidase-like regulatory domain-containing protein [Bryobacteraceae bacterium]